MIWFRIFLYDIGTIIKKEYWGIKRGVKNLVLCFLLVLIMPLIIKLHSERSILPLNIFFVLIPILVSLGTSGQLSMYTIWEEKKGNTLEFLLSTRISKYAIILGKALFPTLLGYILSLLSILALKIISCSIFELYKESLNIFYFIILFFITFIASLITIFIQIFMEGEKFTPSISIIILSFLLFLLWYLYFKLCILSYFIILICIIISILFIRLCAISLNKYNFN